MNTLNIHLQSIDLVPETVLDPGNTVAVTL